MSEPTFTDFPEKLEPIFEPSRYKILYGGRGGAKSWGIARAFLIMGAQRPILVLCCREIQKSIEASVYRLLKNQIKTLGLESFYEVQKTTILGRIGTTAEGTQFFFEGLRHNGDNLKSYEGVDYAWVEEAQVVSRSSWETLIPTIRKDGSEIWVSFNPMLTTDETYQRFVVNPPPDSIVIEINWRDNPWFPEVLNQERLYLATKDPDAYLNVWEGRCRQILEGAIFASELRAADAEGRITRVPIERGVPVNTFWDLGHADLTTIWFAQPVGMEFRIIDYYQNQFKDIPHYLKTLQERGYLYGTHFLPHDAHHRQLSAGGRTIKMQVEAGKLGRVTVIPRVQYKKQGIQAARAVFSLCWFDEGRCADGLQALRHYRYEKDQETGQYKKEPNDDWACHAADAFQQLGLAIELPNHPKPKSAWDSAFADTEGASWKTA